MMGACLAIKLGAEVTALSYMHVFVLLIHQLQPFIFFRLIRTSHMCHSENASFSGYVSISDCLRFRHS